MSNAVYGITLRPISDHVMEATGGTDGRIVMGPKGTPNSFTPVELLLAAIAGCSGIDLQTVSKNAGVDPGEFQLRVRGSKPLGGDGLTQITVEYAVPGIEPDVLEPLIAEAKKLCTVSLTVENSCPVNGVVAGK
jgi:putative redox protein